MRARRGAGALARPLALARHRAPRARVWSRSASAASSFCSDDDGRNWTQAASVPTQALLTGVCFLDAQHGIAVGHDLVALTSSDAGRTWQRTHYAPEAQQPLLDVWCGSGGRAIAVGAYSTYLSSSDRGATWTERRSSSTHAAAPAPGPPLRQCATRTGRRLPPQPHRRRVRLAALHRRRSRPPVSLGRCRRELARSCPRPTKAPSSACCRSSGGRAARVRPARPPVPLGRRRRDLAQDRHRNAERCSNGGTRWGEAGVALVGLSGVVLVSRDGGRTFTLLQQADHRGWRRVALGAGDARHGRRGRRARDEVSAAAQRGRTRDHASGRARPRKLAGARVERWLERSIFGHRTLILVAVRAVTLLLGVSPGAGCASMPPSPSSCRCSTSTCAPTLIRSVAEFRGANRVLIALIARDGNMFTPEFFEALKQGDRRSHR